jgi:hypothetical protein
MTSPDDGPQLIGPLAKAWVEKAYRAWQVAAARDPDRFLYVPAAEPGQAGQLQRRWVHVLGGRAEYATWRLSNVTDHVAERVEVVETWLTKGRAKPLLIEGTTSGTGKTCLACATAHAWWRGGAQPVVFARVGEALDPQPEVRDALRRAGELTLVVLDDLTSVTAAWQSFTDLTERLRASGVRIITTTNMPASDRRDPTKLDPRVRRRLCDDAVVVPMPDVRLADEAPAGPNMEPCPYGCNNGQLIAEDHPDAYEVTEAYAAAHGIARLPDPEAGWSLEQLAYLRAEAERTFDALGRSLVVPCPWAGH